MDESKLNEKQKEALLFIKKNVLDKLGSTGVQEAINTNNFRSHLGLVRDVGLGQAKGGPLLFEVVAKWLAVDTHSRLQRQGPFADGRIHD